jgi:hypothetical protein
MIGIHFISRFFNNKDELRLCTFRRRLSRGGGSICVSNTYVVVVDDCIGATAVDDLFEVVRSLLLRLFVD